MPQPFIFISKSKVKEGKLEDFRRFFAELAEFVEANEPRLIAFAAYVNEDGTEVSGIQVHPDADSMEFHMRVAGERIMQTDEFLKTESVEVYGPPSESLLELMRGVAAQFGGSDMAMGFKPDPIGGFVHAAAR